MLFVTKVQVWGLEGAIRGMRNARESWNKSDTEGLDIGPNDKKLMTSLVGAGNPSHRKFMRMIHVMCDITAPLYWWKEFDTYKVGTTANSTSSIYHARHKKFRLGDFSYDLMDAKDITGYLVPIIDHLNRYVDQYEETKNIVWVRKIQKLMPMSYNQLRTVDMNYEVLANIYAQRQNHPIDEWRTFIDNFIKNLPNCDLIMS